MAEADLTARIRSAVLALELVPGQRLSERGLEPLFGASRTPVRAALMRLESEGLIRRDGKAWQVAPLDPAELRALYEFRAIVESAAVRLATERATNPELSVLATIAHGIAEENSDERNPEHTLESGTDFHREVARLAGNLEVLSAIESVLTRLYRTRWLEVQTQESRDRATREHAAIADALLARDADAAAAAMAEHLRGTGSRTLDALERSRPALRAAGALV